MKVITIGRSSQNDVPISDSKVSRHHLQIIEHDDGSYSLSDFGSTNGTYINGNRVHGEVKLNSSDVVRIGNTTLQWRNYFNNGSSNGSSKHQVSHPDHTPTPIDRKYSMASSSNSSATTIVLSLLGVIVLVVILIVVIALKVDGPNKNSGAEPWHYENGVRTNVPGGRADYSSSIKENVAQTSDNRNSVVETNSNGSNGATQYSHNRKIKPSPAGFSDVDVTGTWVWRSDDNYFELALSRSNEGRIVGGYCASWGDRETDCDEENVIQENRTREDIIENTVQIRFASAAWDGAGTALILKLSDDKIQWKLRSTDGESRVPKNVVLQRE